MKRYPGVLIVSLTFLGWGLGWPAPAQGAEVLGTLTPAEQWVKEQAAAGEKANLKKAFGKPQELRGPFLERLLTGAYPVHRHGINISGAIIVPLEMQKFRRLDLILAEVPYDVSLEDCIFRMDVNFQDSEFKKNLSLKGSCFEKEAHFLKMKVMKSAYFDGVVCLGLANFSGVYVGESVNFQKACFKGKTVNFHGLDVGRSAYFSPTKISGSLDFQMARIGELLDFRNSQFCGTAEFTGMRVGVTALFENSLFNHGAVFTRASVGRDLRAAKVRFSGDNYASFNFLKVENLANFSDVVFMGPVDFDYASIGQELSADRSKFENSKVGVEAVRLSVTHHASFRQSVFKGPVNFSGSTVGGKLNFSEARFEDKNGTVYFDNLTVLQAAQFSNTTFEGPVSFSEANIRGELRWAIEGEKSEPLICGGDFRITNARLDSLVLRGKNGYSLILPKLNLSGTTVERGLILENCEIDKLQGANLQARGDTSLNKVKIKNGLDLQDSDFQALKLIEKVDWPPETGQVQLSGITFKDLETYDYKAFVKLFNKSCFNPNSYVQLEDYFKRTERHNLADKVYIAKKERELQEYAWYNPVRWALLIFWGLPTGFGHAKIRVFWLSLIVILLGMTVFNDEYLTKDRKFTKIKNRFFQRFMLSVDLFLPKVPQKWSGLLKFSGIDLGVAKDWHPATIPRPLWWYLQIHKTLGFIISIIFVPTLIKLILG